MVLIPLKKPETDPTENYPKIDAISKKLEGARHVLHYRMGAPYLGNGRIKTPLFTEKMDSNLRKLLEALVLSDEERLSLACQIAEGLSEMHARGIIHNDLETENIFVRKENGKWVAYIGDYDLSYEEKNPADLVDAGSLYFAAPEKYSLTISDQKKGDIFLERSRRASHNSQKEGGQKALLRKLLAIEPEE